MCHSSSVVHHWSGFSSTAKNNVQSGKWITEQPSDNNSWPAELFAGIRGDTCRARSKWMRVLHLNGGERPADTATRCAQSLRALQSPRKLPSLRRRHSYRNRRRSVSINEWNSSLVLPNSPMSNTSHLHCQHREQRCASS